MISITFRNSVVRVNTSGNEYTTIPLDYRGQKPSFTLLNCKAEYTGKHLQLEVLPPLTELLTVVQQKYPNCRYSSDGKMIKVNIDWSLRDQTIPSASFVGDFHIIARHVYILGDITRIVLACDYLKVKEICRPEIVYGEQTGNLVPITWLGKPIRFCLHDCYCKDITDNTITIKVESLHLSQLLEDVRQTYPECEDFGKYITIPLLKPVETKCPFRGDFAITVLGVDNFTKITMVCEMVDVKFVYPDNYLPTDIDDIRVEFDRDGFDEAISKFLQ